MVLIYHDSVDPRALVAPSAAPPGYVRLQFAATANVETPSDWMFGEEGPYPAPLSPQTRTAAPRTSPKTAKKLRRPTRHVKVKARAQPRTTPTARRQLALPPPQTQCDDDFAPAASTDSSLEGLSPETRKLQAEVRDQALETCSQASDRESLDRLMALSKANHRKAILLDHMSLKALERATEALCINYNDDEPYSPRTISDDDVLPDYHGYVPHTVSFSDLSSAAGDSVLSIDRISPPNTTSEPGTDSYFLVSSQPTQESDDVLHQIAAYVTSAIPVAFIMPTLSMGRDSAGNSTMSSGRSEAPIEELIAQAMAGEVEEREEAMAILDQAGYDGGDESDDESFVMVGDGENEVEEGWFDVVTESMVKSTKQIQQEDWSRERRILLENWRNLNSTDHKTNTGNER